jgi:cysteine desulfurase
LWLRQGISVEPLMFGGGQERERRSGTHNVAGIVGTAAALVETRAEMDTVVRRVGVMRDRLVDKVTATVGGIHEVAPRSSRVPGSAHVCVEGVENEALLFLLDQANVCASAASACASGAMEPSHVLHAMGVDPNLARGALRMTLGHTTADADIDLAISALTESITHLRRS